MSGNINNTNVDQIKSDIKSMLNDLEDLCKKNEDIISYYNSYKKKYLNLYNTSKSLFNFIINNYGSKNFDQNKFNTNIKMMLNAISDIQQAKITQEKASMHIGQSLASQYFPKFN